MTSKNSDSLQETHITSCTNFCNGRICFVKENSSEKRDIKNLE